MLGAPARYPTGLVELGSGVHAWLQPNGDLGESNAGLIVGSGESLLVDTLWDLALTRRMLAEMRRYTATAPIRTVVNTHADGDHCWGNQLLPGAEIVATHATRTDLLGEDPRVLRALVQLGRPLRPLAGWRRPWPGLRAISEFAAFTGMLGRYDFAGIRVTGPRRTFTGMCTLEIGGRRVELLELGPAHTPGDAVVHLPEAGVVFTGDLVFAGVAPIMWVGPVENWIAALDRVTALAPSTVVPGHGPVVDLDAVHALRAYWVYVAAEVRRLLEQGLDPLAAATRILHSADFGRQPFADWDAHERLAVSAHLIARSDAGASGRVHPRERARLLLQMARLGRTLRA